MSSLMDLDRSCISYNVVLRCWQEDYL